MVLGLRVCVRLVELQYPLRACVRAVQPCARGIKYWIFQISFLVSPRGRSWVRKSACYGLGHTTSADDRRDARFCLPHSPPQTESQEIYQNTTKIQHCPVLPSPISKRRFARIFYFFIYFFAKSHEQILSHLNRMGGVAGCLFCLFSFFGGVGWVLHGRLDGFDSWLEE